MKHTNTVCNKM